MLKKLELLTPTSCLNRAATDEPLFVLRAKDLLAPQTLRHWAAMSDGTHEPRKIEEALACAEAMEKWRAQRYDADGKPHPRPAPTAAEAAKAVTVPGPLAIPAPPSAYVAPPSAPSRPEPPTPSFHAWTCPAEGCIRQVPAWSKYCRDHS